MNKNPPPCLDLTAGWGISAPGFLRLAASIQDAGTSAGQWNDHGEGNDAILVMIADPAPVPDGNGFSGRKPDPIATSGAGAGGIGAVEAVEIPGELRRVYASAGV